MLCCLTVWLSVFTSKRNLHLIACDVGQGDATLIVYKKYDILIDGGPNNKVLGCLSKYMPFWDRTIEMVILTHPQKDHYFGLIEVMANYKVDYFLANSIESSSDDYQVLKNAVGSKPTRVVSPVLGNSYRLDLMYLDILNPSHEFIAQNSLKNNESEGQVLGTSTTTMDPNEFSIVFELKFKDFTGILTGDLSPEKSNEIASLITNLGNKPVNYIKIPHHGSKNGLSENLLRILQPQIATISVGKNNSYGHPSPEILKMLSDQNVKTFRTDESGDIVIETDGEKIWVNK